MGGFGGGAAGKLELPRQVSDTVENWFSGDTVSSIDDELNSLFARGLVLERTSLYDEGHLIEDGVNCNWYKTENNYSISPDTMELIKGIRVDSYKPAVDKRFYVNELSSSNVITGQELILKVEYLGMADRTSENNGVYVYIEGHESDKVFLPTPVEETSSFFVKRTSTFRIEAHSSEDTLYFERTENTNNLVITHVSIVNADKSSNPYEINSAYNPDGVIPLIKAVSDKVKEESEDVSLDNDKLVEVLQGSSSELTDLINEGENEVSDIIDDSIDHVNSKLSDILETVIPEDEAKGDTDTIIEDFIAKAKTQAGVLSTESANKAVNNINKFIDNQRNSSEEAKSATTVGMSKALTYYTETELDIDTILEGFETSERERISKEVSLFNGRMAALNAVNSSAFIIGNSMIEREFSRSLSDMRGKLLLEKYKQDSIKNLELIKTFMSSYTQSLNQSISNYYSSIVSLVDAYLRSYGYEVQNSSKMYQLLREKFSQILQSQKEIYLGFSQAEITNKENRTLDLRNKKLKLMELAATDLHASIKREQDLKNLYKEYLREDYKIQLATEKEQVDKNLEIDTRDKLWNLSAYQMAGNVIAQASGGAGYIPNNPSKQENAIGTALSVAGAGYKFSGGNPLAAAGFGLGAYLLSGGIR